MISMVENRARHTMLGPVTVVSEPHARLRLERSKAYSYVLVQ